VFRVLNSVDQHYTTRALWTDLHSTHKMRLIQQLFFGRRWDTWLITGRCDTTSLYST